MKEFLVISCFDQGIILLLMTIICNIYIYAWLSSVEQVKQVASTTTHDLTNVHVQIELT